MPELPEVQTTVDGINKYLPGKRIVGIWSDYESDYYKGKENIKDPKYFQRFKQNVVGKKVIKAERVGKNILIHLSDSVSILVHMKMTGHLLYGKYKKIEEGWFPQESGPLTDPFNKYIHLIFELDNGKYLALSDMRKFAKVLFIDNKKPKKHPDLVNIAPDPFEVSKEEFIKRLKSRKNSRVMNVLMDQKVISGIGNIYSDEILWELGIHPEEKVGNISEEILGKIWEIAKKILREGLKLGGDSTSDYRNIKGEAGDFHHQHMAYQRDGEQCLKKGCSGEMLRKVIGGRSAHYCNEHQKLKSS